MRYGDAGTVSMHPFVAIAFAEQGLVTVLNDGFAAQTALLLACVTVRGTTFLSFRHANNSSACALVRCSLGS